MNKRQVIILGIIFTIATIVMRLVPHPWNFSPMGALFLFSGFALSKRWMWLPLVALSATDAIIGTYQWQVMAAVYGSYAVMMFAAYALNRYSISNVLGLSVAGAILFFIATNFAHWMWFGGYNHDLSGLMSAYIAGIPFFRNSMLGYVFYGSVFFGLYSAALSNPISAWFFKSCIFAPKSIILNIWKEEKK